MIELPAAVRAKLEARTFWQFATIDADGSPSATPVWVDLDGRYVIVNTAVDRRKERNARRDPRVTLAFIDPDDPYAWIEIRGRVAEFVEGETADASIDRLAHKYLEQPYDPVPGERRVILRIEPLAVAFHTERGSAQAAQLEGS